MAVKGFFKNKRSDTSKRVNLPQAPEPKADRPLEFVKSEYLRVCGLVGEETLKKAYAEAQVFHLTQELIKLHQEANGLEEKAKAAQANEKVIE